MVRNYKEKYLMELEVTSDPILAVLLLGLYILLGMQILISQSFSKSFLKNILYIWINQCIPKETNQYFTMNMYFYIFGESFILFCTYLYLMDEFLSLKHWLESCENVYSPKIHSRYQINFGHLNHNTSYSTWVQPIKKRLFFRPTFSVPCQLISFGIGICMFIYYGCYSFILGFVHKWCTIQ